MQVNLSFPPLPPAPRGFPCIRVDQSLSSLLTGAGKREQIHANASPVFVSGDNISSAMRITGGGKSHGGRERGISSLDITSLTELLVLCAVGMHEQLNQAYLHPRISAMWYCQSGARKLVSSGTGLEARFARKIRGSVTLQSLWLGSNHMNKSNMLT
jgi:hypothetical protein